MLISVSAQTEGGADSIKPDTFVAETMALNPGFVSAPRRTATLARHKMQTYSAFPQLGLNLQYFLKEISHFIEPINALSDVVIPSTISSRP